MDNHLYLIFDRLLYRPRLKIREIQVILLLVMVKEREVVAGDSSGSGGKCW
jgi:hypothetical protein